MNLTGINHLPLGSRLHCLQRLLPALLLSLLLFNVFGQCLINHPALTPMEPASDYFQVLLNFCL